jgi:hypothetical protein
MTENKLDLIQEIVRAIPELTTGQLHWLNRVLKVFSLEQQLSLGPAKFFDEATLINFGDAVRIHHCFSQEPFSKDKFEYVLVKVLNISNHKAALAPKGNPGFDATVDGVRVSLKTQADKSIKLETLWVSKFMELGKGQWTDKPEHLEGLRKQFLAHLKNYDRIFTLRALEKGPTWKYELVEIPKEVLARAKGGTLSMMTDSKQLPKPGCCNVRDGKEVIFQLYFDGGTERKLQIKHLKKSVCIVHATWTFTIPPD